MCSDKNFFSNTCTSTGKYDLISTLSFLNYSSGSAEAGMIQGMNVSEFNLIPIKDLIKQIKN